jgi:single-strand DNA-binding protein
MGRITHSPELKNTASGTSVLRFSLAIDRRYQKDGEKQTDFINCVAWRQTAEFIHKYFSKGDLIAVTGEIQTRQYEVDGGKRYATEVIVNNASFCGGKNNNTTGGNEPTTDADGFTSYDASEDDLPF